MICRKTGLASSSAGKPTETMRGCTAHCLAGREHSANTDCKYRMNCSTKEHINEVKATSLDTVLINHSQY